MGFLLGLLYIVIAGVSVVLIGLILIQDSKAGGLSAAIAGSGDSFVGASANKGITKFTAILSGIFILLCLVVGIMRENNKNASLVTGETGASQLSPAPGGDTPPAGDGTTDGGTPANAGTGDGGPTDGGGTDGGTGGDTGGSDASGSGTTPTPDGTAGGDGN